MSTRPILHVIYAAYGDALILEYSTNHKRRLLVIDGGPKARFRNGTQRSYITGPYPEFVQSAAKAIWGGLRGRLANPQESLADDYDKQCFAPAALVCSHADEDHYEGLLELVKTFLPKTFSTADTGVDMFFNGPFVFPAPDKDVAAENLASYKAKADGIKKLLREFGFRAGESFDKDVAPVSPQIMWHYPNDKKRIQIRSRIKPPVDDNGQGTTNSQGTGNDNGGGIDIEPEPSPEVHDFVPSKEYHEANLVRAGKIRISTVSTPTASGLDDSITNLSSIIMSTTGETGGNILLTGDSVGWRITEEGFKATGEPRRATINQHLTIFKVPHHGSIKNSHMKKNWPDVKDKFRTKYSKVGEEVSLLEILEIVYGAAQPMDPLTGFDVDILATFRLLSGVDSNNKFEIGQAEERVRKIIVAILGQRNPPVPVNNEQAFMGTYLRDLRKRFIWRVRNCQQNALPTLPNDHRIDPDPQIIWKTLRDALYAEAAQSAEGTLAPSKGEPVVPLTPYYALDFGRIIKPFSFWAKWEFADCRRKRKWQTALA